MALITLSGYSNPKRRPASYKARDAAYAVGGNNGYYIAALPKPYPKTEQQKLAAKRATVCGIKKGINKATLQRGMKCIKNLASGMEENLAKKEAGIA